MPSKDEGWQSGTISALCKTTSSTSENLELKRMYFNFPYYVNKLKEVEVEDEPHIAYQNGHLEAKLEDGKLINFEDVVGPEPPNDSKEYPGAWAWVAHTSGAIGRYHLVFQKYKIVLDYLSLFTEQVYANKEPKNNSSRKNKYSINKNELSYPENEGSTYHTHAQPEGWMSSAYTKTENGRGYWVNSYFVKKTYGNSTGITNSHGQLIFISPLKGDTTCKQSIDKEKETVTLTWESPSGEPTTVSIKTKTNQSCPDNSHTSGGGSGFHCDENVFSVTTEAPETIVTINLSDPK